MKLFRTLSAVLLASLVCTAAPAPASAQTYTELGASPATASLTLGSVAYDNKHDVYLQVFERALPGGVFDVIGRFIAANGTLLGTEFAISTNRASFGLRPKVAYSRGSAQDVFFVTYIADQAKPNSANVFGQLVRYTGAAPTGGTLVGGKIDVSPNSMSTAAGVYQLTGDVAFNSLTSQFMVAWEEYPGPDVMVRLFNTDGSAAGAASYVTAGPGAGGQGAPTLAFDFQRNLFMVVFTGDNPLVSGSFGVYGYLLNGSTGALASSLAVLQVGFNIEPTVTYLPERDGFFAAWTGVTAGPRTTNARFMGSTDTSATLPSGWFVAQATSQSIGAPSVAYDYVSRRTLLVSMRALDPSPGKIAGTIYDGQATALTGVFNMSTVAATISGTYYPTVRPGVGGVIGMAYVNDYATAQFERFGFPADPNPGPTVDCTSNCPPPQPPPDSDGDGVIDSLDACPTVPAQTPNGCPSTSAAGDFNGDGQTDLVWENSLGQVYYWRMNAWTFTGVGGFLSTDQISNDWLVVGVGDFNGNGKPDLLWQRQSTGQPFLFFYNGTTKVGEQAMTMPANTPWRMRATGDFNADGKTDIIFQNVQTGEVALWFMTVANGLAQNYAYGLVRDANLNTISLGPGTTWRIVGTGDVNGDGHRDIVWQNDATGALAAWFLNGLVLSGWVEVPGTIPQWKVKSVADYNGDGKVDLLFHHNGTGETAVWLLNGGNLLGMAGIAGPVDLGWQVVGAK